MRFLTAALSLAILSTQPSAAQSGFAEIWATDKELLLSQGIDEPTARSAFLWTELQYHLGRCRAYLDEDDLLFWRMWWKDKALAQVPVGKKILEVGDQQYYAGFQDARTKPLSKPHCQRIFDSVTADIQKMGQPPKPTP